MSLSIHSDTTNGSYIQTEGGKIVPVGRRNYLINGNFDMWQRGAGFAITTVSNTYCADRNIITLNQVSSGTLTVAQNTVHKDIGFNYCMEINATSLVTTGAINSTQIIESLSVRKMAGKTVTLTIRAKVLSGTTLCSLTLIEGTNIDAYPTGGAITASNITLTTSYQNFSITVPIATTTTSIACRLNTPSAFNGIIYHQAYKLEDGLVATDGWHPYDGEFGGEVQACQRYYWKQDVVIYSDRPTNIIFPVSMRVTPSISGGGAGFSISYGGYRNSAWASQSTLSAATLSASAEL